MALSKKDQTLLKAADLTDGPDIAPHSRYDQSISFDDDGSDGEPGAYSPRPDPNDPPPNFAPLGGTRLPADRPAALSNFELNFPEPAAKPPFGQQGGYSTGFAPFEPSPAESAFSFQAGRGLQEFSPRPSGPSPVARQPASSPELAQLFSLISKFQPAPLELQPHCQPFLPSLVPSIGAIDAFIKVPRPDGEQDALGLSVLDEPTIGCSNPQILRMQLREKFGVVGGNEGDGYIGFIDSPSQNQKALTSFLESFDEISRNRAAPTMSYSYKMPDLEDLMQVWPDDMEAALSSLPLPTADMDMSLEEYTKVICAMLDIPVKGNIVESLHVLFSLYQMFKDIGYFAGASRGSTPKT
jgi:intraflagellar transport protein 46